VSRGRAALVAAGLIVGVVAVGLAISSTLLSSPVRTEVGVVVAVESVSLADVRGFTIRTPDGRVVVFRVGTLENGAEFPPGHLGEHQATASPIRVTYRDEGADHVAIRLEDAAAAATSGP